MARAKGEKEELEFKSVGSVIMDSSVRLMRFLCVLIIFVIGVVLGLASSSHIDRYFTFQSGQFLPNRSQVEYYPSPANCTVIQNCQKEDCLTIENFIRPNSNLTHKMSDEELFWRASLEPQKPEFPFSRVPKVAFMFLTRGPLPLLPLWEKFFQDQNPNFFSIYVHALPGFELNVTPTSVFYKRQIPSQNVQWGSVSLAAAERRLLANALLDFLNERFVLLSESCIPIYNFPSVYKYLTESAYSFVESYDDPSRNGRGRYSRHMLPEIRLRDWRKGSQWFEISRILAVKIVSDTKYYTLFKKYCKPACYPDEHYIPTFLHMFYGSLNSNRTVTWVDWSRLGPHPARYEAVNITETFILRLRNNGTLCSYNSVKTSTCYLFARKFAPNTLEALLNLTSTVMGF